jgi:hypothetical protein
MLPFSVSAYIRQVNVSSWYFLPLYFQSVKESTPLHSGLLLFPITVLQSIVGVAAGVIIHRTGRYLKLTWTAMAPTSLGFGLFIKLDVSSPLIESVAGIGVGLGFKALIIAIQSSVEHGDVAAATALMGVRPQSLHSDLRRDRWSHFPERDASSV